MALPSILPPQGPSGENAPSTAPSQSSSQAGTSAGKSSPEIKPLAGTTTIDDKLSIECEMLCYSAMSKIAKQIAKEFHNYHQGHETKRLALLSEQDRKALLELDGMLQRLSEDEAKLLELLKQESEELLELDGMLHGLSEDVTKLLELSQQESEELLELDGMPYGLSEDVTKLLELLKQESEELLELDKMMQEVLEDERRIQAQPEQERKKQLAYLSEQVKKLLQLLEQNRKKLRALSEQVKKLQQLPDQDRKKLLALSERVKELLQLQVQDRRKLLALSEKVKELLQLQVQERKNLFEHKHPSKQMLLQRSEQVRKKQLERKDVCVIFLDNIFKTALQLHQTAVFQIDLLEDGYQGLLDIATPKEIPPEEKPSEHLMRIAGPAAVAAVTAAGTSLAAAAGLGHSAIDLLSLFRTDVSYAGRSVAIKEAPLVLELARNIHAEIDCVFLYPSLLLYEPSRRMQASTSKLEKLLANLYEKRRTAEEAFRQLAAGVAEAESDLADRLSEAKKASHHNPPLSEIEKLKKTLIPDRLKLEAARSQMEALSAMLKSLENGLLTPDAKSGIVPLHLVLQAEELLKRFQDTQTDTYFCWAEVSAASGSYQIRRTILGNLIGWGDGLHYSGGVIVTYAFIDGNANIVVSGTHRYREPFTQFPEYDGSKTTGNSFKE